MGLWGQTSEPQAPGGHPLVSRVVLGLSPHCRQWIGGGETTLISQLRGKLRQGGTSWAGTVSPGGVSAAMHHRLACDSLGRVVGSYWAVLGGRPQACREAAVSGTRVRQWGRPSLAQVSGRSRRRFRPGAMEPVGAWGPAQTAAWLRGEAGGHLRGGTPGCWPWGGGLGWAVDGLGTCGWLGVAGWGHLG